MLGRTARKWREGGCPGAGGQGEGCAPVSPDAVAAREALQRAAAAAAGHQAHGVAVHPSVRAARGV